MRNRIYSRDRGILEDAIYVDSGNTNVLTQQSPFVSAHARFYFRPNTPALYHAEGVRPPSRYRSGACPVPVAFLFDSVPLLTSKGAKFSNGNTANRDWVSIGNSLRFLEDLPFDLIYHDSSISSMDGDIVFHRHAEVLIPDEIDLTFLQKLCFRSGAELQTFLALLEYEGGNRADLEKMANLAVVDRSVFSCCFPSVTGGSVFGGSTSFYIHWGQPFRYGLSLPIHFEAAIFWAMPGGAVSVKQPLSLKAETTILSVTTPENARSERVFVALELDEQLAFASYFDTRA